MKYDYIVETSIPRNFDPEVEGETLDSIVGSCEGIVNWSIPYNFKNTKIHITTNRPLDRKYLIDQLESEFYSEGDQVVLDIIKTGHGDNKLYIP